MSVQYDVDSKVTQEDIARTNILEKKYEKYYESVMGKVPNMGRYKTYKSILTRRKLLAVKLKKARGKKTGQKKLVRIYKNELKLLDLKALMYKKYPDLVQIPHIVFMKTQIMQLSEVETPGDVKGSTAKKINFVTLTSLYELWKKEQLFIGK